MPKTILRIVAKKKKSSKDNMIVFSRNSNCLKSTIVTVGYSYFSLFQRKLITLNAYVQIRIKPKG